MSASDPSDHRHFGFETAGSPGGTSYGNTLLLHSDPVELLTQILTQIRSAKARVWVELYILDSDSVGRLVIHEVESAALRGCDVVLLLDGWGSRRFSRRVRDRLLRAGVRVCYFNPVFPWTTPGRRVDSVLHRDHRKVVLVDDAAFVGGRNISKDYLGDKPIFFDLNLEVRGPAVYDIATVVADGVRQSIGVDLNLPERQAAGPDDCRTSVLELDQRSGFPDLDRAIQSSVQSATRSVSIITPYFVPPRWFLDAIGRALSRGVRVRILTAGKSDVPMATSAGRHIYSELLAVGAEIFEMRNIILHAKSVVIDDRICVVGSYNIDAYGSRHNLELGVASVSSVLAAQLESVFDSSIPASAAVSASEWRRRPALSRFIDWLSWRVYRV